MAKLREKSFEVESKVQESVAKSRTAVFETKDLMEGLLAEESRKFLFLRRSKPKFL